MDGVRGMGGYNRHLTSLEVLFMTATPASLVSQWVDLAVASTPVYDLHTHLYPPSFGSLMLWGIDAKRLSDGKQHFYSIWETAYFLRSAR